MTMNLVQALHLFFSIWELKLWLSTVRSQSFLLPNKVIGRCLARRLNSWIHSWCKSRGSVQLSPSSCGVLPWGYCWVMVTDQRLCFDSVGSRSSRGNDSEKSPWLKMRWTQKQQKSYRLQMRKTRGDIHVMMIYQMGALLSVLLMDNYVNLFLVSS